MEKPTHDDVVNLFKSPEVDGDVMLWMLENLESFLPAEPGFSLVSEVSETSRPEPSFDVPFSARFMLDAEPYIDEETFVARLRAETRDDEGLGPWPLGVSILWHVVLLGMVFGVLSFSTDVINPFERSLSEPIEVSFGFTLETSQALPSGKVADLVEEAEATKTEQQLPQLPKLLAVDAATPPALDSSMALPNAMATTPQPTTSPVATAQPTIVATPTRTQPPVVQQQPDPAAAKKLKLEEIAKRLEKQQRTLGSKEKEGLQKTKAPNDVFKRPKDIPISPLSGDIPKAPNFLGQEGALTGKVSVRVRNEYAQAAASHMKKHWSLPDFLAFESRLEVVLSFDINTAGQIMGRIRVVRGSGNERFDEEAVRALEAAGPFPDLPKEMGTKLSLRMKFSPQNVNF